MRIDDNSIRVNRDTCIACGICVDRCIMDNLRLSVAPCRQACPLDMNCQGYIRLLALGKEEQALEQVRAFGPLLGVIARECTAPCESACTRRKEDGAVHILKLKQYLAQTYAEQLRAIDVPGAPSGKRVAVVGADIAAMACALRALQAGHGVTVFIDKDVEHEDVADALKAAGAAFRGAPDLDPIVHDAIVLSRPGHGRRLDLDVTPGAVDTVSHQVEGKVFCVDSGRADKGVVYAIAEAFETMCSVDRFFDGVPFAWGRDRYVQGGRVKECRVNTRVGSNAPRRPDTEPDSVFDAATAREQASRCFGCGRAFERNKTCWYCLPCELECPQQALEVKIPYLVRQKIMTKMTRRQVVGATIVLLAAAAFFVTPFQADSEGSAVFPRAVSVLLGAFGILIVLLPGKSQEKDSVRLLDPQLLLYMALVLGAVIMIQVVGFYPVIPVVIALCLVIFGERNFKAIIPFALITTAAIYFVIDYLLGSMLP